MNDILDLKNPEVIAENQEPVAEKSSEQELDMPMLTGGPESVSWTVAPKATERERTREYMLLGGAALLGSLVAYWQSSWLTFAVIVLGVAAWELHNRLPATHRIDIDAKGVSIDGYRHRYEHLHSYDMHTMPDGTAHLSVMTTRWHLPRLHIPLGEQDPGEVHAVLSHYLIEDEHLLPLLGYFVKK